MRIRRQILILILGLAVTACTKKAEEETPASSGSIGVVALNTNISSSEALSTYTTEYQAAYSAGARGAQTAAPWSSINTTGGTFDLAMITNSYFGLSALQGYGLTSIYINIPVVAISARTMPADIAALAFNHATVKTRLRATIDQVVPYLNSNVKYVCFGNEVDTYFSTHSSEWAAYVELVEDARTYLKSLKPDILVGVSTTFEGASSTLTSNVATLNANMDIIALTYYPISGTFVPRSPSTVSTDMQTMANLSSTKPIIMQEWGYPSSATLSSSESNQAEFMTNTFSAWRTHGSTRFPFISFFKRRDWNAAHCGTITGQVAGQNFYEFMCSLGLLSNGSTQKSAYQILLNNLQ